MNLYVVRHAIAARLEPASSEQDSQRPLTEKGRSRMRLISRGLRELEIQLDVILTSPYLRATQTALILAKEFDLGKARVVSNPNLAPSGDPEQLVKSVHQDYGDIENLCFVGHEPSLSSLISMLIVGDPTLSLALKKGGVCKLLVDNLLYGRCAALEWILSPAQLVKIAGRTT